MPALLSSAYFAPIQWYQKLNRYDVCLIEQHDHFVKQTYRNRCVIATANGVQTLSIPVEKFDDVKCEMKDVRISDHDNWRHQHWNALLSAYGESPFFEYYQDDIRPFYEKKWKFLFDFNMEITHTLCELLDIQSDIRPTEEFLPMDKTGETALTYADFREVIRPKRPLADADFVPKPYYQVYEQKIGFQPNLSILDLLFNMGNESIFYL
jgi:wbqC-like protein